MWVKTNSATLAKRNPIFVERNKTKTLTPTITNWHACGNWQKSTESQRYPVTNNLPQSTTSWNSQSTKLQHLWDLACRTLNKPHVQLENQFAVLQNSLSNLKPIHFTQKRRPLTFLKPWTHENGGEKQWSSQEKHSCWTQRFLPPQPVQPASAYNPKGDQPSRDPAMSGSSKLSLNT